MDFCQYPKQQLYQYIVWMINGTWTKGSRLGRSSHWPVNAIRASEAKSKVISRSSVGTLICDLWKSLSDLASVYCLFTVLLQIESGGKCISWTIDLIGQVLGVLFQPLIGETLASPVDDIYHACKDHHHHHHQACNDSPSKASWYNLWMLLEQFVVKSFAHDLSSLL